MGTVVAGPTDKAYSLTRKERKEHMVDELLADTTFSVCFLSDFFLCVLVVDEGLCVVLFAVLRTTQVLGDSDGQSIWWQAAVQGTAQAQVRRTTKEEVTVGVVLRFILINFANGLTCLQPTMYAFPQT